MADKDFYKILGVDKKASDDELKKAYRKLAMQFHPDKNPGDKKAEQKFKEISEAYDVLKDQQKRAAYDRYGSAAFEGGMGGGRAGAGGFQGFGGFSDIFEEMFGEMMGGQRGGGRAGMAAQRGADTSVEMQITLEEAFKGKDVTIKNPSWQSCEACHATGAEKGTQPETCATCRGAGRVRAQQGFFTVERTCGTCHGTGQTIRTPCTACKGQGRVRKERSLQIKIPAGIEDGTRMRLTGEGEAGLRGGPPGDLYVFISLKDHRFFQREGADLHCRVPVPLHVVALSGTVEAPTIDGGRVKVNVPAGTQTGTQFRLKSKGMSVMRTPQRGDMYVEIVVETPVNLSKKQRELLQEFAREGGEKINPQSSGFFDKVKDLWEDLKD